MTELVNNMAKGNKTFAERFRPIFERYKSIMPELLAVDSKKVFYGDYWAPLKLYCFASYIHSFYVPIIKNYVGDNFYFIDLLSSSGITQVSKCDDCVLEERECATCKYRKNKLKVDVAGSSLLAATSNPPFKKMYLVDLNDRNLDALMKRIAILETKGLSYCKEIDSIKEDCNKVVEGIITEIAQSAKSATKRKYHFLAFIDNQGLDANWTTIDKLLNCYCDLIINFPTSSITRNLETDATKIFLGCGDISELNDLTPLDYYVNKIRERKSAEIINIKTGQGFHYDLIVVTKKDSAKFKGYIDFLKKTIESNDAGTVEIAFKILLDKQAPLFK
jgi:three-Cys-motif partner protein